MNVKNDILEELRSLSELVATISRQTPYRVAEGYFTDLSGRVMLRIKTSHKPMVFNVPEGYFEGFAEGLMARIKAGAGAGAVDVPGVPGVPNAAAELAALSPLLAELRHKETYRMPEGWLDEMSPILAVAKELNPYTVPEEYFHQLPAEVQERLVESDVERKPAKVESDVERKSAKVESDVERKPAKVMVLSSRRTNWWKYSAAAVVAGLVLAIGWLRWQGTGAVTHGNTGDIAKVLPKVSDQDLQSFLADTHDDDDTPVEQSAGTIAALSFNDNDMNSLLGDVPDGDLKQYMDEHGGGVDIATN